MNRHRLNRSNQEICDLMEMVGGHFYLVRVALYQAAKGRISLKRWLKVAPTEESPYCDHLRRHLVNLEKNAQLAATIRQLINSKKIVKTHLYLNKIDLVMQQLKGIPEPVRLYKLIP